MKPLPAGATTAAQAQCLSAQADARKTSPSANFHCESFGSPTPSFAESYPEQLVAVSFVLLGFGLLAGASSTGYDVSTGSLSTWLMFEPRRLRVLGTKCLAAAGWVIPWSVACIAMFAIGSWGIHVHFAKSGTMEFHDWLNLAAIGARSVGLVAVIAALGAALAILFKHTGVVVAALAGWVLIEVLLPQLDSVPWLLLPNIKSWVMGGMTYEAVSCGYPGGTCRMQAVLLPLAHSGLYLGIIATCLFAIAAGLFQRRSIT